MRHFPGSFGCHRVSQEGKGEDRSHCVRACAYVYVYHKLSFQQEQAGWGGGGGVRLHGDESARGLVVSTGGGRERES